MNKEIVGKIQGHDVIYVPEKDLVFCKNSTIPYPHLKKVLFDKEIDCLKVREDLVVRVDQDIVTLGCLTTTLENCRLINKNIKKVKKL